MLDKLVQSHKVVFIKSAERSGGKGVFKLNGTSAFNFDQLDSGGLSN